MKGRFQIQRRIGGRCGVWRSAVLAAVLWGAVLSGTLFLAGCGRAGDETEPALEQEAAEADVQDEGEQNGAADAAGSSGAYQTVVWQGETYTYNEHLSNFLFLGIDTRESVETETGMAGRRTGGRPVSVKLRPGHRRDDADLDSERYHDADRGL